MEYLRWRKQSCGNPNPPQFLSQSRLVPIFDHADVPPSPNQSQSPNGSATTGLRRGSLQDGREGPSSIGSRSGTALGFQCFNVESRPIHLSSPGNANISGRRLESPSPSNISEAKQSR